MLYIFINHALMADKFKIEAVLIETLMNEAFIDRVRVLVLFFKHAFTTARFTIEAVFIVTFLNKAFVHS